MPSIKKISPRPKLEIDPECAICLTDMEQPCQLPCQHAYCYDCIQEALKRNWECPICRAGPPKNFRCVVNNGLAQELREKI